MFHLSILKGLKHGSTHKPTLQMGLHVLGFLGQTRHLFVSIFLNNVDPEFSHLLQLLHCLFMNAFRGRWCLFEFAFSMWLILDSALQYGMWNPRNPFLHLDWIIWTLWKPYLSIHQQCVCIEASNKFLSKHQTYILNTNHSI